MVNNLDFLLLLFFGSEMLLNLNNGFLFRINLECKSIDVFVVEVFFFCCYFILKVKVNI